MNLLTRNWTFYIYWVLTSFAERSNPDSHFDFVCYHGWAAFITPLKESSVPRKIKNKKEVVEVKAQWTSKSEVSTVKKSPHFTGLMKHKHGTKISWKYVKTQLRFGVTFVLAEARPKTKEGSRVQKLTRKRLLLVYYFKGSSLLQPPPPQLRAAVQRLLRYHKWWIGKPLGS